jgi:hypothetical protein
MYFEDIATKDLPALPIDHEYRWLEDYVKKECHLSKKPAHDKEHEAQLIKWGCKPEHISKLTIRFDEKGQAFADRMYHICLHLKYWKEENIEHLMPVVERFEKQSGYNLDELTLPSPKAKGESVY